jgi:hypothetical protein
VLEVPFADRAEVSEYLNKHRLSPFGRAVPKRVVFGTLTEGSGNRFRRPPVFAPDWPSCRATRPGFINHLIAGPRLAGLDAKTTGPTSAEIVFGVEVTKEERVDFGICDRSIYIPFGDLYGFVVDCSRFR